MAVFRSHKRNLAKIFLIKDEAESLNGKDYPSFNILLSISELKESFDDILLKYFNFSNLFPHPVNVTEKKIHKLEFKYNSEFLIDKKNTKIFEYKIKNNKDNFFNNRTNSEIRVN